MDNRLLGMSDELSRAGNLFLLISTDPSGMNDIRAVNTEQIAEITTAPHDPEQELSFILREDLEVILKMTWSSVSIAPTTSIDTPDEHGNFQPVMVHYAVNRPAEQLLGELDLSDLLKWLGRYSAWLEDRVRLNRFRNAFLYVVKASYTSETARKARQLELAATSLPRLHPRHRSERRMVGHVPQFEAMMLYAPPSKMIAAGAWIPMHFLAEPESATRTTAELSSEPTYHKFEQRQQVMICNHSRPAQDRHRQTRSRRCPSG